MNNGTATIHLEKEVSNVGFGSITVPSIDYYREYLLTVGVYGNGSIYQMSRVLASSIIPADALIKTYFKYNKQIKWAKNKKK